MITGNRHYVGPISKELISVDAQQRVRRAARLELLFGLPLLILIGGLIWLFAGAGKEPAATAPASQAGLELVLSGAVNAHMALGWGELRGAPCAPTGFDVSLSAEQAAYPSALTFEGDPFLSRTLPVHYDLGPGVPPLTLELGSGAAGAFRAYTGSVTVGETYRRFSAYMSDTLGRQLYVSGYLTCPA